MAEKDQAGVTEDSSGPRSPDDTEGSQFLLRFMDLKFVLALLFLIFGTLVTIAGIVVSPADLAKSAGININLWTGMALLGLSAVFAVWWFVTPTDVPTSTLDAKELSEGSETEIFEMP